ncbi:uncharacterized protein LOC62_03G003911 [Vanrija pseudolonga]|uniref:BTB domain-containing protein n=1 Tax=Vanrija pseudolonga TaxID=143232 RepID=A0AAF0Y9D7_9TREE|nr:hypothetical protein LOC62_03G003911 [Vanrija pseudolonga]
MSTANEGDPIIIDDGKVKADNCTTAYRHKSDRSVDTSMNNDEESFADDEEWTEGDFTLISSDNVRFQVPSYYLFAASPVFRNAGEVSNPGTKFVAFTDRSCESAVTLRDFLYLVKTGMIPVAWDEPPDDNAEFIERIAGIVLFLRKYECDAILHILKLGFNEDFMMSGYFSTEGIILGANADDVEYCVKAINASEWTEELMDPDADKDPIFLNRSGSFELLPCNMSFTAIQHIPVEYYWALSRSWKGNKDAWPDEFRRLVKMARRRRQVFAAGHIEAASSKGLYLTDNTCEEAATIREFLSIITTGDLAGDWLEAGADEELLCQHIAALTAFLKKYKCEQAVRGLQRAFSTRYSRQRRLPLAGLVLGALTDDLDLCTEAMSIARDESDMDPEANFLLPANMSLKVHLLIPNGYLWALATSWTGDWDDWPLQFRQAADKVSSGGASRNLTLPKQIKGSAPEPKLNPVKRQRRPLNTNPGTNPDTSLDINLDTQPDTNTDTNTDINTDMDVSM